MQYGRMAVTPYIESALSTPAEQERFAALFRGQSPAQCEALLDMLVEDLGDDEPSRD